MPSLTHDPQQNTAFLTREKFRALEGGGLLGEGRFELLQGETSRLRLSELRCYVGTHLLWALEKGVDWQHLRVFGSLAVDDFSELQPDIGVTKMPGKEYLKTGIPPGSEFRLVVEVSDSTLWRDKGQKARLYATAGVPEYWVVNLTGRTVIVHRRPVGEDYQSIVTYNENESISPEAAPEHVIALAEIFPPVESNPDA